MGAQKNRLNETVLLSTHNICFDWEMRKIFFCYALLTKVLETYNKLCALTEFEKGHWPNLEGETCNQLHWPIVETLTKWQNERMHYLVSLCTVCKDEKSSSNVSWKTPLNKHSLGHQNHMVLDTTKVTKPVFGVSDKSRLKPVSSATETSRKNWNFTCSKFGYESFQ